MGYWERRSRAAKNKLPKHLRPLPRWPIVVQMVFNLGITATLTTLMIHQEDYVTEAGPAVAMVICLLTLIYTLISAFQLKRRYKNIKGRRLAQINFWFMAIALLMFPLSVAVFLP